jgi:hypothetical protein
MTFARIQVSAEETSKCRSTVQKSGGIWLGIQETNGEPLAMFQEPETKSSVALPMNQCHTREQVEYALNICRARFVGILS